MINPRRTASLPLAVILVCLLGCGPRPNKLDNEANEPASLRVVSGSQLTTMVQSHPRPVLVEFGVDYNCPRCENVRTDVVELAQRLADRVEVVRVDYVSNARLVAELGGTICPTYVLFADGEPVLTRSFPIGMDLLESELEQTIGTPSPADPS